MVNKEEARKELQKLIKKYSKYKEDKDLMKNERQVCDSLIRPFFRDVLGWDIEDPYEFKSEYTQGGKRMDYMACIEGVSQFVVEAKAPSREVEDNTSFYKQTIQYAESKGKDFAILTNFRHFIIFRAGIETRGPLVNEIIKVDLLNLTEQGFDFLWYFSKDFWVEKGEENPLYHSLKHLKRKRPLDEVLVEDMSKWREYLLRSLRALSKEKYDFENEEKLEYIEEEVQRFVDRLIFICYCEDKQLNDNELKPLLTEYKDKHVGEKTFIIKQIKKLFETYNKTYNSDLFKEDLCDEFEFDDNILSEILEDLRGYYEGLPYDFSVIDADILGRAYENFLGHIITGKKRFKEKKDIGKRKKMGIYYTPQYIVNYIVKNTVREYVKNKSFDEILKIKILDPACGSGSFLIKVFDVLVEESKAKLKRELTYEEKKNLMLNCIHGVDLDERACDIAKLNLSLKLATRREKLPELYNNIQNGNSLIDDPKVAGDKAFKWEERFPFKFDIVIGNPPYGAELNEKEKKCLKQRYTGDKTGNTASFFIFLGNDILKNNGHLSFIVPKQLTYINSWEGTRKLLLHDNLTNLIDVSESFGDVELEQVIFKIEKSKAEKRVIVGFSNNQVILEYFGDRKFFSVSRFPLWITEENNIIFEKILENTVPLKEIAKVNWGGPVAKYLSKIKTSDSLPCLRGREIMRYSMNPQHFIKKKDIVFPYYIKGEKLLFQRIVSRYGKKLVANYRNARIVGTYSNDNNYADKTVTLIWNSKVALKFLLAFFNSKLTNWFAHRYLWNRSQLTMEFMYEYARKFPIKLPNKKQEQKIVDLVNQMLSLQKKFHDEKTLRKDKLKEEIEKIDEQINQEVYKLYGLTKDEIRIVEESLK